MVTVSEKWAKYFQNRSISELSGLDLGSIFTVLYVHMFANAPCSKNTSISGWAPKSICKESQIVVLLCY